MVEKKQNILGLELELVEELFDLGSVVAVFGKFGGSVPKRKPEKRSIVSAFRKNVLSRESSQRSELQNGNNSEAKNFFKKTKQFTYCWIASNSHQN